MTRFWTSWWSGRYADEGCTQPPFQFWCTGEMERQYSNRTNESYCALLGADNRDDIVALLKRHFPDMELRFISERAADWKPNNRFPKRKKA